MSDFWSNVGTDVASSLASGAIQLGYDALIRGHNEKREDTRYQRLADDLHKAGFSKNIVSGATASANQSPTSDLSFLGDSFSKGMDRKLQKEQLNLQRAKNNAEVTNLKKTNEQLNAIIEGLKTDNLSKLEDLKHKKNVNAMNDLQVLKLTEEVEKLKRDKDRLELEKERTKSYVDKQNIEREIKTVEKDLLNLDYNFINGLGFPPIFWNKQGSSLMGGIAFGTNTLADLTYKLVDMLNNGKPVNSSTSPFKNFIRGVILGDKSVKKYWK